MPSGGRQAWAFLPLAVAGEILGTLVIGYGAPRDFDDDERANLAAFAALCAQAMQRALLYETQVSIAGELQELTQLQRVGRRQHGTTLGLVHG